MDGKDCLGSPFIKGEFMSELTNILSKNDFNFKKKYGQNFLMDHNILSKIVSYADIKEDSLVIEIGVGAGSLTFEIAKNAKTVIGYEIDEKLKPIIEDNLKDVSNTIIIYDDFLKRNIKNDIKDHKYKYLYVIANLPYYITTPIINKLIDDKIDVDKIIIMIQKEVADRLNAKPDSRDYNSLTIFINYYFKVSKLFDVSRNVFIPKPNVDSTVILLEKRDTKVPVKNEKLFFDLVKKSFKYKRKNLKNNLKEFNLTKIEEILKKYNLDLTIRAEHLTIDQFADISNHL